ncbi:MAG TPA: glycosyltransferase [Gemmatimonadales bacterium]|nr:glycosyltransferase [Gemmatimonadales bacterium]
MARRVLVISYHMPSDGEVGGLRWAGLTKYLGSLGWQSWILTAAPPATDQKSAAVTVEFCPRGRSVPELYRWLRRAVPGIRLPPHRADLSARGGARAALLRPFATLRSEASGLLYLLSEGYGWTLRAARRARSMIRRIRPDVVVSTSPPHPTHLAAWMATRGTGVRWIVDLRDPWARPVTKAWAHTGAIANALAAAAERLVIRAADGVFTTTRELADQLATAYPDTAVTWIPNGVDLETLPSRSSHPFPGLGIAHLGTLYGGRDAGPVLKALRLLIDQHPAAACDGTMFRHAGQEDPAQADATRRAIATLDLAAQVALHPVLPRAQALDLLARSGLAIVLAQDQDYQIPSKLYESVAMGIPTLVIAGRESAAGREAVRLGAFFAQPEEVGAIARLFEGLWSGSGPHRNGGPPSELYDYRARAPAVAALLEASA